MSQRCPRPTERGSAPGATRQAALVKGRRPPAIPPQGAALTPFATRGGTAERDMSLARVLALTSSFVTAGLLTEHARIGKTLAPQLGLGARLRVSARGLRRAEARKSSPTHPSATFEGGSRAARDPPWMRPWPVPALDGWS